MNKKMTFYWVTLIFIAEVALFSQPVKVELRELNGQYSLFRNGNPYYIKGAGGSIFLDKVNIYGGNSIRTWGVGNNMQKLLDEAKVHNLTVLVGLPVLAPRHDTSFYSDAVKIAAQKEHCRNLVMQYKDHPSVLVWALGNELDIHSADRRVYDAVNDIALMIKAIDPNHPVITVVGGFSLEHAMFLKQKCTALDFIGINYYGDLSHFSELVSKSGWNKPYVITEWGPIGHWMSPRTQWGAYIEQTSSQKANMFLANYQFIKNNSLCIGSYVFYWSTKQEKTITWYSMFMRNGEAFETIDAMNIAWEGKPKQNKAPRIIHPITINGKTALENVALVTGKSYTSFVEVADIDRDTLFFEWLIMPETTSTLSGGDFEEDLQPVRGIIQKGNTRNVKFKAPVSGKYRLYVFVRDGKMNIATANIPFIVKG